MAVDCLGICAFLALIAAKYRLILPYALIANPPLTYITFTGQLLHIFNLNYILLI
jgi:hypothetical protein